MLNTRTCYTDRIKTRKQFSSSLLRVKFAWTRKKWKKWRKDFAPFLRGARMKDASREGNVKFSKSLKRETTGFVPGEQRARRRACSVAANVILRWTSPLKSRISIYPASSREYRRRVMLDVPVGQLSPAFCYWNHSH